MERQIAGSPFPLWLSSVLVVAGEEHQQYINYELKIILNGGLNETTESYNQTNLGKLNFYNFQVFCHLASQHLDEINSWSSDPPLIQIGGGGFNGFSQSTFLSNYETNWDLEQKDKKKSLCKFIKDSSLGECRNGDICPYSHETRLFDAKRP